MASETNSRPLQNCLSLSICKNNYRVKGKTQLKNATNAHSESKQWIQENTSATSVMLALWHTMFGPGQVLTLLGIFHGTSSSSVSSLMKSISNQKVQEKKREAYLIMLVHPTFPFYSFPSSNFSSLHHTSLYTFECQFSYLRRFLISIFNVDCSVFRNLFLNLTA